MCCLGRRRLGRRRARSTRAALASMLARATLWCEVARACCLKRRRWLGRRRARSTRAALASMLARATVWCEVARACCLGPRRLGHRCDCFTRATFVSTLARATVWREAARVPPRHMVGLTPPFRNLKAPAATTGARCVAADVLQKQLGRGGTTTSKAGFHVSLAGVHSSMSTL